MLLERDSIALLFSFVNHPDPRCDCNEAPCERVKGCYKTLSSSEVETSVTLPESRVDRVSRAVAFKDLRRMSAIVYVNNTRNP
jgi:hypothetical protein